MTRRREYFLHYATARPFAQYAVRVKLSQVEKRFLEERLVELIEAFELHSFNLIDLLDLAVVNAEVALHEIEEACRA